MQKLPLYVALDFDDTKKALLIAHTLSPYVEGFKIGPRLYLTGGLDLVLKLTLFGKVFLDFKFFDIPSTMVSSVQTAFNLGVDLVTVHAQAGMESLIQLATLEKQLNTIREFKILAVTVLTSFSQKNLPPLAQTHSVFSHVESLSDLVIKSGLKSLVCSGEEVEHLRKRHPQAYLVTPGIRFSTDLAQDQKRVFTPQEALKRGASALVMGRSIYKADFPVKVCKALQKQLFTKG